MPTSLVVQKVNNDGVTYSLVSDPDLTVRFRNVTSQKSLNGVSVKNFATEIIINDNNGVTVNGVPASDAVSIRVRVSAAAESNARVVQLLAMLAGGLNTWATESVFKGFNPATAPSIT
jgi:hypothetical protein